MKLIYIVKINGVEARGSRKKFRYIINVSNLTINLKINFSTNLLIFLT